MTNVKHWPAAQLTREAMFDISETLEAWGWAHDIVIDATQQDEKQIVHARRVQIRKPRITARSLERLQNLAEEHDVSLVFNHGRLEFR